MAQRIQPSMCQAPPKKADGKKKDYLGQKHARASVSMPSACGERSAPYTAAMRPNRLGKTAFRRLLLCAILCGGCVERTITINSSPPGALVYLNDEEIGRTPVTRDFTWYGDYSVTLREDGYETIKTHQYVVAPLYEFAPIDLFSELLPFKFHDDKEYGFILEPTRLVDDQTLINRALDLKGQLGKSQIPTTRPATR